MADQQHHEAPLSASPVVTVVSESRGLHGRGAYRLYLLLGFAVIALGYLQRNTFIEVLFGMESRIRDMGPWAPLIMMLISGTWATLCLPGPVVLGLIGTMFASQPLLGLAVAVAGDCMAVAGGFQIARHLGRERVRRWLETKPWFVWLEMNTERRGYWGVFFVRTMPFFPNSLANYALGLTALRFWPYLGASMLGSLPNTALYVFGTAGTVALLREGFASPLSLKHAVLFLLGVALVVRGWQAVLRRRFAPIVEVEER